MGFGQAGQQDLYWLAPSTPHCALLEHVRCIDRVLYGCRVETADGLLPMLNAAFSDGGVHLVTVPIDYSENMRVLVEELRARATQDQES